MMGRPRGSKNKIKPDEFNRANNINSDNVWVDAFNDIPGRPINEAVVIGLMESIKLVGVRNPVTYWEPEDSDGGLNLLSGRHRVEACKRLGLDTIPACKLELDEVDRELWTISENLHRADLTPLEHDTQAARWLELTAAKLQLSQSATNESKRDDGRGHRKEGGTRAAAREIGLDKDKAARAVKIASLSPEAKEAAVATGLDNNRTAMLKAAEAKGNPDEQVAILHRIAEEKAAPKVKPQPREIIDPSPEVQSFAAEMIARFSRAEQDKIIEIVIAQRPKW